ncbi:MAG: hypothetical protein WD737_07325 [Gemmatimonadota bacterium]
MSGARLTAFLLLLAVVGGLLVAYLWETLNRLLSGFIDPVRLLISIPVAVVFVLLLRSMGHAIERWHSGNG